MGLGELGLGEMGGHRSRRSSNPLVGWGGNNPYRAPPLYVYKVSFCYTNQKIVHASDIKDANKTILGSWLCHSVGDADPAG